MAVQRISLLLGMVWITSRISAEMSCPVFGTASHPTTDINQFEPVQQLGLFMNFEAPSRCNGVITSWFLCSSFRNGNSTQEGVAARLLVYRRIDTNMYNLVQSSNRTYVISRTEALRPACREVSLNGDEFTVQEDDVIGACIFQNSARYSSLYLTFRPRDSMARTNNNVYYNANFQQCTDAQIATVNTGDMQILPEGTDLYLQAVISTNEATEATTTLHTPTTTPATILQTPTTNLHSPTTNEATEATTILHSPTTTTVTILQTPTTSQHNRVIIPQSPSLQTPNTTIPPNNHETPPGVIAGIVLVVLMTILTLSLVTIILLCLILRWRIKKKRKQTFLSPDITITSINKSGMALEKDGLLNQPPPVTDTDTNSYEIPYTIIERKQLFETSHINGSAYENTVGKYEVPVKNYKVPTTSIGYVNESVTEEYYATIAVNYSNQTLLDHIIKQESQRQQDGQRKQDSQIKQESPYQSPANDEDTIYHQLKQNGIKLIREQNIRIETKLGAGQFGIVYKGVWTNHSGFSLDVAVKSPKKDTDPMDRVKLLQEAAIMAQFRHPNVVTLCGVCKHQDGYISIIVEYLAKGDLHHHLKTIAPSQEGCVPLDLSQKLLEYSQQICLGMGYLAQKGFVHRDLAARNILLSSNDICKIADFGMSRDLSDTDYYLSTGGKIPIKWTAPEAIHYKRYSTASDVWSYGCVLYEIWSLGHVPFEGIHNVEIIKKVSGAYRLPPPAGCPQKIYEVMLECWAEKAEDRPSFEEILLPLVKNTTSSQISTFPHNEVVQIKKGSPSTKQVNAIPAGQTQQPLYDESHYVSTGANTTHSEDTVSRSEISTTVDYDEII